MRTNKLLNLLKESERTLTDKLKDARKEMEKMTTIINQLWPFIQTHLKRELGATKIANLKKMAKQESRITFLETLSNVIGKVKKDAEREGRALFGSDIDSKFDKITQLKLKIDEKEQRETQYKGYIDKLKVKLKELDSFRLTATDYIMTKATSQEEVLFLVRANERISSFQEKDLAVGEEKFEDGGFITNRRHYEILDDYEPAPAFIKTLTNEILYLDSTGEESLISENVSLSQLDQKLDSNLAEWANNIERISIPDINSSNRDSNIHIQNINSNDQVPELIKHSLSDSRQQHPSDYWEDIADDDQPSFGKGTLMSLKQQINSGITSYNMNGTGRSNQLETTGLSSAQYDKLGTSLDLERRLQPSIHSRQVQPSNTSQKLLPTRINAYAGDSSFDQKGQTGFNKTSLSGGSSTSLGSKTSRPKYENRSMSPMLASKSSKHE